MSITQRLCEKTINQQTHVLTCIDSMGKPGIPSRFSFGRKECREPSRNQVGTKQSRGRVGADSQPESQPESGRIDDNRCTSQYIVHLDEGQYVIRYQQYTGNPPAFDIVGQPFVRNN